jgi:hypothetical protein
MIGVRRRCSINSNTTTTTTTTTNSTTTQSWDGMVVLKGIVVSQPCRIIRTDCIRRLLWPRNGHTVQQFLPVMLLMLVMMMKVMIVVVGVVLVLTAARRMVGRTSRLFDEDVANLAAGVLRDAKR